MRKFPAWVKVLGGIGVVAAATAALAFVPTGDVVYEPAAPIDLDGKISVDGQVLEPLQGRLFLVGVRERKVNLLQRSLLDLTDPDVDFAPAPEEGPDGGPSEEDIASMADAKHVAAGVAFDMLEPGSAEWTGNGAAISSIAADSPAAGKVKEGDIINAVNGTSVDAAVEVSRIVSRLRPGALVQFDLVRAGQKATASFRTVEPEEGDEVNRSRVGLGLTTPGLDVELPRSVSVDSGEVVGPSAGLAFTLFLYDALSGDDLLRGRHVVASGAISPDGQVLPVGRMRQKAISAQQANRDLLLVPLGNADEARSAVATECAGEGGCLTVVPVRSAADAVRLLELDDEALEAELSDAVSVP